MKTQLQNLYFRGALEYKQFFKGVVLFLFLSSFVFSAYAQQGVKVGSTAAFYESLKPAGSINGRVAAAKKSLKVGSQENLTIAIKKSEKRGSVEVLIGKVDNNANSYVFFTFSDGSVKGKVVIPGQKKAYRYYSENDNVFVASEDIHDVLCVEYAPAPILPSSVAPAPPAGSYVYNLQSLPGANAVVMLDFDGHDATGSWWGDIIAAPANLTEEEIELAWHIMSDDFRPYDLNITTNEAVYQAAPANRRMRCIFTPTTDANPGSGGVAFISSFNDGGEFAPCWVFNLNNGKDAGETGSHEIGHTMHLTHDGRDFPDATREEYYFGHGDWAPIMGASFSPNASHWSIGEYQYANNQEDDIDMIGTLNGFGFRSDAQGNSIATAAPLVVAADGSISASQNYGIIADRNDLDYFSFTTTGSNVNFLVSPAPVYPNLDLLVSIVNSAGATVASQTAPGLGSCSLTVNLAAGTYYLKVDGTGSGNPFTDGYSDYSSIGEYRVSGNVSNVVTTAGISGPSCVIPNQAYTFTLTTEFANSYGTNWWVSGDATVQQDPLDPKKATITFSSWNASSVTINATANYHTAPWYQLYQKTVQVGNCAPRSVYSAVLSSTPVLMKVKVMDLNGREMLTGETFEPETFIKNQYLPSGLYLMQVVDESSSYVIKVVK